MSAGSWRSAESGGPERGPGVKLTGRREGAAAEEALLESVPALVRALLAMPEHRVEGFLQNIRLCREAVARGDAESAAFLKGRIAESIECGVRPPSVLDLDA